MTDPTLKLPIQSDLINDGQALAKELNISWSRLLTLALRDFIRRYRKRHHLTAQINAAYAEAPNEAEIRVVQGMRSTHRYLVKDEW